MRPLTDEQIWAINKVGKCQVSKFLATQIKPNVFNKDDSSILSTTPSHQASLIHRLTNWRLFINCKLCVSGLLLTDLTDFHPVSPVSIHLIQTLSSSITFSIQAQNLPFQQILPTLTLLLYPLDCLHDHGTGPDRTYHAHQFIFSFFYFDIFCSFHVVD